MTTEEAKAESERLRIKQARWLLEYERGKTSRAIAQIKRFRTLYGKLNRKPW